MGFFFSFWQIGKAGVCLPTHPTFIPRGKEHTLGNYYVLHPVPTIIFLHSFVHSSVQESHGHGHGPGLQGLLNWRDF